RQPENASLRTRKSVCLFLALFALCINGLGQLPDRLDARALATKLETAKNTIAAEVSTTLKTNRLNTSYTTVWRQFEDAAIDALCEVLPKHFPELAEKNFDRGKTGREK